MEHNPRVWEVTNEPYADEIRFPDGWYWQDEEREFPSGPFSSEAEAREDYRTQSSEDSRNG